MSKIEEALEKASQMRHREPSSVATGTSEKAPQAWHREPSSVATEKLSLESQIAILEAEIRLQRELNDFAKEQIRRSEVRETELHRHIERLITNKFTEQNQVGLFAKILGKN